MQVAEDDEQHGVPADVWSCLDVHPRGGSGNNSDPPAPIGPEVCPSAGHLTSARYPMKKQLRSVKCRSWLYRGRMRAALVNMTADQCLPLGLRLAAAEHGCREAFDCGLSCKIVNLCPFPASQNPMSYWGCTAGHTVHPQRADCILKMPMPPIDSPAAEGLNPSVCRYGDCTAMCGRSWTSCTAHWRV